MNFKGHGIFVGTKRGSVFGFEYAAFFIYNFFRVNGRLLSFLTFNKNFRKFFCKYSWQNLENAGGVAMATILSKHVD